MKRFQQIIAVFSLLTFGVSFATVEAHSAGLCGDEAGIASVVDQCGSNHMQAEPVSDSSSDQDTASDCHCPNSANCSVLQSSSVSFLSQKVSSDLSSLSTQVLVVFLEGLSRPPCV